MPSKTRMLSLRSKAGCADAQNFRRDNTGTAGRITSVIADRYNKQAWPKYPTRVLSPEMEAGSKPAPPAEEPILSMLRVETRAGLPHVQHKDRELSRDSYARFVEANLLRKLQTPNS